MLNLFAWYDWAALQCLTNEHERWAVFRFNCDHRRQVSTFQSYAIIIDRAIIRCFQPSSWEGRKRRRSIKICHLVYPDLMLPCQRRDCGYFGSFTELGSGYRCDEEPAKWEARSQSSIPSNCLYLYWDRNFKTCFQFVQVRMTVFRAFIRIPISWSPSKLEQRCQSRILGARWPSEVSAEA